MENLEETFLKGPDDQQTVVFPQNCVCTSYGISIIGSSKLIINYMFMFLSHRYQNVPYWLNTIANIESIRVSKQ